MKDGAAATCTSPVRRLIDPRTGRPVSGNVAAVTVIAPSAGTAEALAQAVLVLGTKDGLALVDQSPGAACLILEYSPSPAAPLIPHRSADFAALEFVPTKP